MSSPSPAMKAPAPPKPSATVLIVRDGTTGLEVFMLVRNRMVDFASGALVFPGGKVDAQDASAEHVDKVEAAIWPERQSRERACCQPRVQVANDPPGRLHGVLRRGRRGRHRWHHQESSELLFE